MGKITVDQLYDYPAKSIVTIECSICGKESQRKILSLRVNVKNNKGKYVCHKCKTNQEEYKEKQRKAHPKVNSKYKTKVEVKCSSCGKQYKINYRSMRYLERNNKKPKCMSCVNKETHRKGKFSKIYTDSFKDKLRNNGKEFWSNVKEGEWKTKYMAHLLEDEEYIEYMRECGRRPWENDREYMVQLSKERWKDQEYRDKVISKNKEIWSDPAKREEHSRRIKEILSDPGIRERMSEISRRRWCSAEYREIITQKIREYWSDENVCKDHSDKIKALWNDDLRQLSSDRSKELWKDPEYREKVVTSLAIVCGSDEYRLNVSKAIANKWKDPEYRSRIVEAWNEDNRSKAADRSRELWQDPEYRERITQIIREFTSTDEYKSKISEISRRNWEDPELRRKASEISKQLWEDSEYRKKVTEAIIEFTSTDEYKSKISEISKKNWEDPELRRKASEISKQLWQDPEFREKMAQIAKERWQDPEYREKMAQIAKERWQDPEYREKMAIIRANQPRISNIQKQLYRYLDDLKVEYYEESEKTRIGFYVFDCLVPKQGGMDKHLLIECQGGYWHSLDETCSRDRSKFTYIDHYFPEYEIMYLWEHEFYNKDGALSRLKYKLGVDVEIVDFDFKDVVINDNLSADDVREFLSSYHYIGRDRGSKYTLGAFLGDKLIAVCVFSSPLRQNTASQFRLASSDVLELSRFCIHPCYHKKNFATWMISRCLKRISCKLVVAYADETVGHRGTIYKACNFVLDHVVRPDYWYMDGDGYVMHKRTLYGRARRYGLTEREYAEKFGYIRRYGGRKFCYVKWL